MQQNRDKEVGLPRSEYFFSFLGLYQTYRHYNYYYIPTSPMRAFPRLVSAAARHTAVTRPLLSTPACTAPPLAACVSRPFFSGWNPFSTSKAKAATAVETQHARIVDKAHREASLLNERLVDASLELLDYLGTTVAAEKRGHAATTTDAAEEETAAESTVVIHDLVRVLLQEHTTPPTEVFDLTYRALCLPLVMEQRGLQRSLMVVLESVLPFQVYRVFEAVDLAVPGEGEAACAKRLVLVRFVRGMLGEIQIPAGSGLEEEEVLLVYLDDVKHSFSSLATCPAFVELEQNATDIALRSRLFLLLGQLCAEFDAEKTGKVLLQDLRETAEKVFGKDKATLMLEGAQTDAEGKIAYTQLTALLTRPPPRRKETPAAAAAA